jgi:uncharacterized protein YcaQ
MTRLAPLAIPNRIARALWLDAHLLVAPPTGKRDVMEIVRRLGFVQIDTIRNVTRAHNHIIWSRFTRFKEGGLWSLLRNRELFEHFTHDASLIPVEMLPAWGLQFQRLGAHVARHDWYKSGLAQEQVAAIRKRIEREGPLSTHAFDTKIEGKREMWARPPHKRALDAMWYGGELATSHRESFVKYYDLGGRVFPPHDKLPRMDCHNFLCHQALARMGFATQGEIQRFWDVLNAKETKTWCNSSRELIPVEIEGADGSQTAAYATPDIEARIEVLKKPSTRMRLLNPFDPAIRDRTRLERLFGFEYRNEMFVPKAQRRWGYYVYLLLEGDRFVGRIELKAERKAGRLIVRGFWTEPGVKWSGHRKDRLMSELGRFGRFAGLRVIDWQAGKGGSDET